VCADRGSEDTRQLEWIFEREHIQRYYKVIVMELFAIFLANNAFNSITSKVCKQMQHYLNKMHLSCNFGWQRIDCVLNILSVRL
jgi:hypothetical protein